MSDISSPQHALLSLSYDEIFDLIKSHDRPKYIASIITDWIYKKNVFSFDDMSNLSKKDRLFFQNIFSTINLSLIETYHSEDGTVKFLFETQDKKNIESVLILNEDASRYTACISSQVGCALRCSFCATGLLGFSRNLSVDEIISQILLIELFIRHNLATVPSDRFLDNIVFMGMGEPFLNFDNVSKSLYILTDPMLFGIGSRRISVSTSGIIEGIQRFSELKGQPRLALSLHAANHEKRKSIMPIARKEFTGKVLDEIREYQKKTGRRVTMEYILIEGFNDMEEDVLALKHELTGIKYNLNVIPLNSVKELPYDSPSEQSIRNFIEKLKHHSITYVCRTPKGVDIYAACGQLSLQK